MTTRRINTKRKTQAGGRSELWTAEETAAFLGVPARLDRIAKYPVGRICNLTAIGNVRRRSAGCQCQDSLPDVSDVGSRAADQPSASKVFNDEINSAIVFGLDVDVVVQHTDGATWHDLGASHEARIPWA